MDPLAPPRRIPPPRAALPLFPSSPQSSSSTPLSPPTSSQSSSTSSHPIDICPPPYPPPPPPPPPVPTPAPPRPVLIPQTQGAPQRQRAGTPSNPRYTQQRPCWGQQLQAPHPSLLSSPQQQPAPLNRRRVAACGGRSVEVAAWRRRQQEVMEQWTSSTAETVTADWHHYRHHRHSSHSLPGHRSSTSVSIPTPSPLADIVAPLALPVVPDHPIHSHQAPPNHQIRRPKKKQTLASADNRVAGNKPDQGQPPDRSGSGAG